MKWSRFSGDGSIEQTTWCAIVGAPRCGTTSLARYLGDHPQISLSNVKEPHFFSRRDLGSWPTDDVVRFVQKNYLDHFYPHREAGDILLDGSVSYLYAPERLEAALRLWPAARFIIAVRNPLEMLPSLHQRLVCNGDEDVQDFDRAWALMTDRRSGRHIPRSCVDARLLDYEEIGRLGKHVARFFEVVGRERCFVSVFDDLVADPARQYEHILRFLGVPPDSRATFPTFRATSGVRSAALQRFLKRPPQAARSLLASAADLHRDGCEDGRRSPFIMRVRKRLLDWNRTPARPVRLSARLKHEIGIALADDVATLSGLLGRDLSRWMESTVPQAGSDPSGVGDPTESMVPAMPG